MWRTLLAACLTLGTAAPGLAEDGAALPPFSARACAPPPLIDGILDDAAWKAAAKVDEFHVIGKDERTTKHRAMVTYDNAWLYVAFEVGQGDMARLAPKYIGGHDDYVQRDDCVKVSFDPGGKASPWYHFKLNRANTRQDRRIQVTGANEIHSWNIPWKSAVRNAERNWTVEAAIPFCQLYPLGRLADARLNLIITTFVPRRDQYGVVVGTPARTDFSLSPVVKTCFEPERFLPVKGLEKVELESAFLPLIERAELAPYFEREGKFYYGIDLVLKNYGARPGTLVLKLEDKTASGQVTVTDERVELAKNQLSLSHRLAVPASALERRSAVLRVIDGKTGEEWQKLTFAGDATRALDLFGGYLDRNYYTSEEEAAAVLKVGLPENALSKLALVAEDGNGKGLAKTGKVAPETMFRIPIRAMPLGRNAVRIRLTDGKRREVSALSFELIKRAPNPGCEWKVDRINRLLLNNGKPFFAMGFCAHTLAQDDVETVTRLKDNGFNFVQLWEKYDAAGMAAYARMFEREGLHMMPAPDDAAAKFRGPYKFKHPKASWCKPRTVTQMKCHMVGGGFAQVSRADRNAVFREYIDYLMPDMMGIAKVARDSRASLGYFIFDEPMIQAFDQGLIGRELYDKINEVDGYHPVLVNYSSDIPGHEQAVGWMDILCTDPYWVPGAPWRGDRGGINYVSMITARTVARGEPDRLVAWSLPMCNYWSGAIQRGATREEQLCQTYLAAIHGATGIMYFTLSMVRGNEPVWEAAAVVARQFDKVLGPACVAPGVKHSIKYSSRSADGKTVPAVHDPVHAKFVDIQMALKRDPDGGYILMAANGRYYPVACEIAIRGLTVPKIGRHFADDEYRVENESFTDKYEAYGVRAYRIPPLSEPVEIRVTAVPPASIPKPEKGVAWRRNKKNKLPNPSFEQCTVPGWPDYCFGQNRPRDGWKPLRGTDDKVAKFGKRSVRLREGIYFDLLLDPPPDPGIGGKYVFSVWLRCSQKGRAYTNNMNGYFRNVVDVTTAWQRYEVPFVMPSPPRPSRTRIACPTRGSTLWVDGAQLERGERATEFED